MVQLGKMVQHTLVSIKWTSPKIVRKEKKKERREEYLKKLAPEIQRTKPQFSSVF
jgi:hypothetical protein